jgi:hypothetical protein
MINDGAFGRGEKIMPKKEESRMSEDFCSPVRGDLSIARVADQP